jgi:DNA-binding response OmpR family regulator
LRIAIVEDNPADIFLIKQALFPRNRGAELTVMQDGEAGFDFIQQIEDGLIRPPDIFILDLSLPRRNGPELLERIRLCRRCDHVRILIASSSHNPRDKAIAQEGGADAYFVKPSNFKDFMKIADVVKELLDRRLE